MTTRYARPAACALRRVLLASALSALVCLSAFAVCASAFTEPGYTGTFADFANCPANLPSLGGCLHSYITGGVIQIGHAEVPISVPGDTLDLAEYWERGKPACEAIDELYGAGSEPCVVSPPHGILGGPAQPVPGGLLGSIGDGELTAVQARLEWAQPVAPDTVFGIYAEPERGEVPFPGSVLALGALLEEDGPGLRLPVRLRLSSPFLAPDCSIGSAANPLTLALSTGVTSPPPPNEPLAGELGSLSSNEQGAILMVEGTVLVDNSFSVPAASGCGTLMDAAIDQKLGLPSPAGQNTAVIIADVEQADVGEILLHGWSEEPTEAAAQEPAASEPQPPAPTDPAPAALAPQLAPPLSASAPAHAGPGAIPTSPAAASHPPACEHRPRPRHGKSKRCATRGASSRSHPRRHGARLDRGKR